MEIEMLFIDFQQAFDSINRNELKRALKELGVGAKLGRLIMMTMEGTMASVLTQKGETEEFEFNRGVRQGDALSATLFNLALQYVLRRIKKGTLRTKGEQIVAYADDIALITRSRGRMREVLEEMATEGAKMGLKINEEKTKIMRIDKECKGKKIRIGGYTFEEVEKFKYLGVIITNKCEREAEIREKIITTNRIFYANKRLLKSKTLSKSSKMKIYKVIIRPVLLYAAETLSMTQKQEEDLRIVERKIMRTVLGPIRLNEHEYRRRTNEELAREMEIDVVRRIKQLRARWLGHVWRAGPGAVNYDVTEWRPGSGRRRGRPKSTWMKEVERDIRGTGESDWKQKTSDRKLWNKICDKV